MLTEMLDRLQENKLRGLEELEELIESYQTQAAAAGADADQAAAIADFFVDEGIGMRQSSLRLWDYHWAMALAGEIPDRREHRTKLRALLERGGRLLARGAAVARVYADFAGCEVARLSQLEEQAKTFPLWIEECMALWEMLDRPPKPLNREMLAQSQAAYERGECEDAGSILARLKQGGPLQARRASEG